MATSTATTIEAPILLDAAPDAPEVIDSGWNPGRIAQRRTRWGSLGLAMIGVTIIFGTWLLLSAVASIIGFFSISAMAGGLALTLYLGGVGLLFYAVARELLSLRELHQVDALRAALSNSTTDVEQARALCKAWLIRLSQRVPDAISVADALGEAIDTAQLRALMHNRLDSQLSAATRRIGIKAASQGGALVALSPHASWDGVIVGWHGLRVIRLVAQAHALRPGPAMTLALLRRVTGAALETASADLVSQAATDRLLGSVPLLKHLVAAIPEVSLAGMRLYRLAAVAAYVCSPFER
jgi:putative membrane protein